MGHFVGVMSPYHSFCLWQFCSPLFGLFWLVPGFVMDYLSYLQCRCRDIRQRLDDPLRYSREPKSFWFYRLLIGHRMRCSAKPRGVYRPGADHHLEISIPVNIYKIDLLIYSSVDFVRLLCTKCLFRCCIIRLTSGNNKIFDQ